MGANSVKLIGKDSFIEVPLYKRIDELDIVYINERVYETIFHRPFLYGEAKQDILSLFSVTMDESKGLFKMNINGYVDYQSDPTDIAMNGNLGSGRAFYLYDDFNIKGEKTPLATSTREDYNNGYYSMESSIEEALISELIITRMSLTSFETLCILDNHVNYKFPYVEESLPCSLMLRYAPNKTLYRVSHRFHNKVPYTKEELYDFTSKLGILEGNKFINRFIHGAWSIGNISIDGNMIDLDTSFFTKGRGPVWSYTPRFKTNYFGFEYLGDEMILETILHSELNIDKVSLKELSDILRSKREEQIKKMFPTLLGYNEEIYLKYKDSFDRLCESFMHLSTLMYDNYMDLSVVDKNVDSTYLFDFSNLFRHFELLLQRGNASVSNLMSLLINKDAREVSYDEENEEAHDRSNSFFKDITIKDMSGYSKELKNVMKFLRNLLALDSKIKEENDIDVTKKLIDSYLTNETLDLLTGKEWFRGELVYLYNKYGGEVSSMFLNTVTNCYSRFNSSTDLQIFEEGIISKEIDYDGVRIRIRLNPSIEYKLMHLFINGKRIKYRKVSETEFVTEYFDLLKVDNMNAKVLLDSKELSVIGLRSIENKKRL